MTNDATRIYGETVKLAWAAADQHDAYAWAMGNGRIARQPEAMSAEWKPEAGTVRPGRK